MKDDQTDDAQVLAPLPIVSICLESVTRDGLSREIGKFLDLTQAEDVLRTWAEQHAGQWPEGIPLRAVVEFPRRLVHTCELAADEQGRVRANTASDTSRAAGLDDTGYLSLRDQVAISLRLTFASRLASVEALRARRVARIVLAYGDPA
ncbi:MAG: hypothetical protein RL091_3383 [Verrucomicrobiota bacterium]|jgi:hypothetical protein